MITTTYKPLTKNNILKLVPQEKLMATYTGVPTDVSHAFSSPLRKDVSPSCSYFYSKSNILYIKDWSENKIWSVFDFIMDKYVLSFKETLEKINKDFNLKLGSYSKLPEAIDSKIKGPNTTPNVFSFAEGDFTEADIQYWKDYGVSKSTLKKFGVKKGKILYKNGKLRMKSTDSNPIYIYTDYPEDGFKVYRPHSPSKRNKWLSYKTGNYLNGLNQIPQSGDLLFITSSLKDVMCLHDLGFASVALQSETHTINDETLQELQGRYKYVLTFFDNDECGINSAATYFKKYHVNGIVVPHHSESATYKDISDYVFTWGKRKSKKTIKKALSKTLRVDDLPF